VNFGGGDTTATIASRLATAMNGSPVATAVASGNQVNLTSRTAGLAGNTTLSVSYAWNSGIFAQPSFTATALGVAGGYDAGQFDNSPYRTIYSYDALGNLVRVDQKGSAPTDSTQWRSRTFVYDSFSRLLTATNPESGTIAYAYDADGELLQKTSPAPNPNPPQPTQTVSYCYDELHRVSMRDYQAHTFNPPACPITAPVVSYAYDSGANAIGHLTSLTDQAGTATYAYDILGRMTSETRPIAGISKSTSYTYNLDGSVKTLTYPSGRVVTYTPDSAGRLVSAVDGNGTNYVVSASYNPDSSLKSLVNGSTPALSQNFQYTPRLQLCRITTLTSGTLPTSCTDSQHIGNIMDRGYDFHAGNGMAGSGADNGNVFAITNYRDTNRSQAFTYDALNRLTSGWSSANSGAYSWGENYSIDAWGNLQISPMQNKAHGGTFQLSGNAQNRPTGMNYDAAGNLLSYLTANYTYDQENRLSSTAGMAYTYDGNGERILKSQVINNVLTPVKRYWSMGGNTLAEGDGTGNLTAEYIYLGGKRVARIDLPANTVHYYLSDHLASTSIVANAAGAVEEESDYYPFGTEVVVTGPGTNELKFTGKRRDTESQLDYFGARYYSNAFGRFSTPDSPFADQHPGDPQSWNLYTYTKNNPLRFVDDNGHTTKPAEAKFINDALATDPTLRNVILRSNNFSPGGFEDAYKSGRLSNLDTGVGNTLRGLAGEAQVINEINADMRNPGAAFAQPTNLAGVMPDIGWTLGTNMTPGAVLLNVATAGGGLTDVRFGSNLSTAYMEVKSGLSASSIPGGVTQAVNTAAAINKAGLGGSAVSVLIVDAGAWSALSAKQREQLINQAQSGGAYIQVQPGLADAARKRAQRLVDEAQKREKSH
jgi:RHS repeat-associated protein